MRLAFALALAGCWTAAPRGAERAQDLVASGVAGVSAIRVDEAHVYVLTDRMLARVEHGGGRLEPLAAGRELAGLALDATRVYWGSDEGIHALPKAGGEITRLVDVTEPVSSIAIAGDLVVIGSGTGVLRVRPGTRDPPLMPVELDGAMPIVAGGLGAIYAATRTALHRIDRNGFAEQLLDSPGITALALDKHRGYLGEGATIRSFVRNGRTEPVADVAGVTSSIAVDAQFIYWTATEPAGIYRQDKRTGSRTRFANVREPGQLVIANGYLYWTEPAAGRVVRRRL